MFLFFQLVVHSKALARLCRVCGRHCVKYEHARFIQHGLDKYKHASGLLKVYKFDVSNDDKTVHPRFICLSCQASLTSESPRPSLRPVIEWTPHGETGADCKACQLMISSKNGPRPRKTTKVTAQRRKELEAVVKEMSDVEAACVTILRSRELIRNMPFVSRKLKEVASLVVKCMLKGSEDDTIELPTGGPVSTATFFP